MTRKRWLLSLFACLFVLALTTPSVTVYAAPVPHFENAGSDSDSNSEGANEDCIVNGSDATTNDQNDSEALTESGMNGKCGALFPLNPIIPVYREDTSQSGDDNGTGHPVHREHPGVGNNTGDGNHPVHGEHPGQGNHYGHGTQPPALISITIPDPGLRNDSYTDENGVVHYHMTIILPDSDPAGAISWLIKGDGSLLGEGEFAPGEYDLFAFSDYWGVYYEFTPIIADGYKWEEYTEEGMLLVGWSWQEDPKPVDPDPEDPQVPEEPAEPGDPQDPEDPQVPEEPAEPEDPQDPEEPAEPEDPIVSEDPSVEPEDPLVPEEPAEPEDPTVSEDPSAEPENPAAEPADPPVAPQDPPASATQNTPPPTNPSHNPPAPRAAAPPQPAEENIPDEPADTPAPAPISTPVDQPLPAWGDDSLPPRFLDRALSVIGDSGDLSGIIGEEDRTVATDSTPATSQGPSGFVAFLAVMVAGGAVALTTYSVKFSLRK
ncbi:MAG: hypothetical protein WAO49_04650 [Arcanobacterium sp.]